MRTFVVSIQLLIVGAVSGALLVPQKMLSMFLDITVLISVLVSTFPYPLDIVGKHLCEITPCNHLC